MEPGVVLVKTPKGQEEIEKRTHKLPGRLRAVLFMIDGERSVGELLEQAGGLAEQLAQQLDELRTLGHVTPLTPAVAATGPSGEKVSGGPTPPSPAMANPSITLDWTRISIEVLKARLNQVLTESMGMRATFLTAQVNAVTSHAALEQVIEDIAHGMATTAGARAATTWRQETRAAMGLPVAD